MNELTLSISEDKLIPTTVAKQVLTVGPDHINYRGGVGSVMNVYAQHFAIYKYITTHKATKNKWQLIPYFIKQYGHFVHTLRTDDDIKIVHIQGSFKGSFYRKLILFLTAKYAFDKKVIYHMHGSKFDVFYQHSDPISRRLIKLLVEKSDSVICLSTYWHSFFSQNFSIRRLEILGNVIHQRQTDDSYYNRSSHGPLNILFLGAIGERKGIFDLLDVLRQHKDAFLGRLVLRVGGNGEVKRLQAYIEEHELESLVYFEGWVSGEKKHELLSTSDVYILPSYHEGLPISILEAMSYHLPIISTPVGGTAEAVQEGLNGFLIQPGDREALYECLMRFVTQPTLSIKMGQASASIVQQYLPKSIFPQLLDLYKSMLASE